LTDPAGRVVFRLGVYLGRSTNNEAEYKALILGVGRACEAGVRKLDVVTDSQLVVRQIQGLYRVSATALKSLHEKAKAALAKIPDWTIEHVPREQNVEADRMAGEAAFLGKIGKLQEGDEISGADHAAW
jgi:ribonuclease HI